MSDPKELVLWGFHPRYSGPAGVVPIKLFSGSQQQVEAARTEYAKRGGWTLGIYAKFDEPLGLRVQCHSAHGTPHVEFPSAGKVGGINEDEHLKAIAADPCKALTDLLGPQKFVWRSDFTEKVKLEGGAA